MKSRNTFTFIILIIMVILISYSAIFGVDLGRYEIMPLGSQLDLGLDLAGGVYVVLEAKTDLTGVELDKKMNETKAIIEQRVNGLGVAEPNITIENEKRIRVELAGLSDPQAAIDMIGKTAQLEFIDPEGNVVLTGENVKKSEVTYDKSEYGVSLEFDKVGTENFANITADLITKGTREERIIKIVLDNEIISSPAVEDKIANGKSSITGNFTVEGASNLANLIRAGALPMELEELEVSVIGPTLGIESLDRSVFAALIGLLLIYIFMIAFYKLPGLIADIGLTIYILIVLGVMVYLDAKLTLPGIAGLILSIGMAVDANVVIFERIKEEIRTGKSIRTSVESGFKRALTTVIDANVTTLIAGFVLLYFGTGSVKGFAVTLLIGIIASLITAVFITRSILKLTTRIKFTNNKKYYGVRG